MSDQVLHLLVPGLLGPLPGAAGQAGPAAPTLERWLARGDRRPVAGDADALLFTLFGLPLPEADTGAAPDLPTAALCYLADTGERPAGVVLHADPVYLRADQDRLLLFDAPAADLTAAEASAFVDAINQHFQADGWRLSAPTPGRWYLHLDQMPALHSRPLSAVIGRNIDSFLPQGPDAGGFRQRLTEVQMLLHGLTVNQQRVDAGRLPVSGLWLHGAGELPAPPPHSFSLQGEAPALLQGLLALAQGPAVGQLCWLGRAQRAVWDVDVEGWWQAVEEVERLLRERRGPLWLYPGDGYSYRYGAGQRWRLWRRRCPLTDRLLPQDTN
jgi:hypothetical protein